MSIEPRVLPIEPLTRVAFAPFGQVIEVSAAAERLLIIEGTAERFHDLAQLDPGAGGRVIASIFRGQPRELPFRIRLMERHPRASQAFVPLFGGGAPRSYLVVVAPPGAAPKASELRCFAAQSSQGVNFSPGVWHHSLLSLNAVSDFLVLDRAGPDDNCDEVAVEPNALICP